MGITAGGAMATLVPAHERELIPVPENLAIEHAAAVPEVFMTAYDALMLQAGVGLGTRVLLHAVASGVGTAAVQLARAGGAITVGTSRSADKLARCAELGVAPEHSVHVTEPGKFAAQVRGYPPTGEGVDVILDLVGGAYLGDNVQVLAPRGRIVVVGLVGGISAPLPLGLLLRKRAHIIGTVLRSRTPEEKMSLARAFTRAVVPMLADERVRPVVSEVLPMTDIAEAHRRMEANETIGKLVLRW
jgi:NADPH:quinone reductase-like Zn-dependent oxidoreductase